jgi:type I restriction enzyme M protein
MLQLNATLKALIDKLWDRFWSGGISNPLSAIEQITYLLFMKQLDELDLKREKDAEFTGDTFTSRFKGDFFLPHDTDKKDPIDKATLRWSYFKQMKAELMLPHVQQKVFPFIKGLNGDGSTFTRHMANAVFLIPSANLLQGAIAIIEDIFLEIEREAREEGQLFQDIQGDVYEMLLNEISSAGKNGQFRTPRHIIKLISELVNPQLGHRICDPACGTAGFLLDAYQYIVTQLALKKAKKGQTFTPDDDGLVAQWKVRDPLQPGTRKAKFFFVPVQDIRDKQYDLSFNRYHEAQNDEIAYEEPKVILQKLKALEDKIQQGIAELERIIG